MVVLTTGKTTTTGMLAVLADTSLTGGHVAAAVCEKKKSVQQCSFDRVFRDHRIDDSIIKGFGFQLWGEV